MNTYIIKLALLSIIFLFFSCEAKIQYAKTETYKVWGNCGMCKETIEKAAHKKGEAKGIWDKQTKMIQLTFDSTKTNADEILKRIAEVGYDNEKFRANDVAYAKRPTCCQYERATVIPLANSNKTTSIQNVDSIKSIKDTVIAVSNSSLNYLEDLFENYFSLKDALVNTNSTLAAHKATDLSKAVSLIEMNKLSNEQHNVWMKVYNELTTDANTISKTKDISKQRNAFMRLSKNIFNLIKVSKIKTTVYLDFCPMANNGKGANWLSKNKEIKNPYFGNKMMTCGSIQETIKK